MLAAELASLQDEDFDLGLLGFDDAEIDRLLAERARRRTCRRGARAADPIPSAAPAISGSAASTGCCAAMPPCSPMSRRCSAGELADMCFSDPPYNVNYANSAEDKLRRQEPADPERCPRRGVRRAALRRLRQHPHRHQGRGLHLHVVVGAGHAAEGVPRGRRPLVHVRDLGQEHLHARAVRLSAPVRADPLRLEGRRRSLLVRRPRPGRCLVHRQAARRTICTRP